MAPPLFPPYKLTPHLSPPISFITTCVLRPAPAAAADSSAYATSQSTREPAVLISPSIWSQLNETKNCVPFGIDWNCYQNKRKKKRKKGRGRKRKEASIDQPVDQCVAPTKRHQTSDKMIVKNSRWPQMMAPLDFEQTEREIEREKERERGDKWLFFFFLSSSGPGSLD